MALRYLGLAFIAIIVTMSFSFRAVSAKHTLVDQLIPEFTQQGAEDWLNSEPLKFADLAGQVVLIDFWTFGCWNCYNSFPWLNALQKKHADKAFKIIGVHTPEFPHERDRAKVAAKMAEFRLEHAVMIDNESTYWRALHNRYWPSFYIVDKNGVVRGFYAGETHAGDSQARRIGSLISRLLAE